MAKTRGKKTVKKIKTVGKNGEISQYGGKRSCPNKVLTTLELEV